MYCFMCGMETIHLELLQSVNIKSPFSKKSLRAIIGYLVKSDTKLNLKWPDLSIECYVCMNCFDDLLLYDEYMMQVLTVQKRILATIQDAPNRLKLQQLREFEMDEVLDKELRENDIVSDACELTTTHVDTADDNNENNDTTQDGDNELSAVEDNKLDVRRSRINSRLRKYNLPAMCELCNKHFKNKSCLNKHIKTEHKRRKACRCKECGVMVKDEEYLELHMNIHEGKSEMECRYCSKRYTRRVNVIRHMQKHWDKKKFQCEKCGVRFSEIPLLYNHRLQHEAEEKPLVCVVCNQSFKTRRTYKNHIWTHREDRPRYSCQFCGKTFVEKYTLKVHLRTHTHDEPSKSTWRRKISDTCNQIEERPLDCIICGDNFPSKDKYNQHMEKTHDVVMKLNKIQRA